MVLRPWGSGDWNGSSLLSQWLVAALECIVVVGWAVGPGLSGLPLCEGGEGVRRGAQGRISRTKSLTERTREGSERKGQWLAVVRGMHVRVKHVLWRLLGHGNERYLGVLQKLSFLLQK